MESDKHSYNKWSAQTVVNALLHFKVKDVVVSPGTRDMPLILECDRHPELRKHVVIDERSAAFVALGIAVASRKPVALVCTSGSALLNYAPALAEAYYRHVPLIVLSADRPERWIDQADSQTIRQTGALNAVVKKSATIPDFSEVDNEEARLAALRIFDAMACATRTPQGPVHLNFPFSLPLGPEYPEIAPIHFPTIIRNTSHGIDQREITRLAKEWKDKKILVVCGQMMPDNDANRILSLLALQDGFAVIAESVSNLHHDRILMNADSMLREMKGHEDIYKPDLVIVCGGALVSSKLKNYLRSLCDVPLWYVSPYSDMIKDTFDNLTLYADCTPARFLSDFSFRRRQSTGSAGCKSDAAAEFSESWQRLSRHAAIKLRDYLSQAPWSELKAVDYILRKIPSKYNLHLSNGMTIRYALLSGVSSLHSISCNRGVSGIEGATSTAIGAAMKYPSPTLLISGDMSFSYDIGALAIKEIPDRFKAVVLSNRGGGIFRVISKTSSMPQREEYFCAEPKLPLSQISTAYGFRYLEADSMLSLEKALEEMIHSDDRPQLLNIIVDPEISAKTMTDYTKD